MRIVLDGLSFGPGAFTFCSLTPFPSCIIIPPISVEWLSPLCALISSPIANQYSHASSQTIINRLADIGFSLPPAPLAFHMPCPLQNFDISPFPSFLASDQGLGCVVYFHIFRLTCCTVHRLPSLPFWNSKQAKKAISFRPRQLPPLSIRLSNAGTASGWLLLPPTVHIIWRYGINYSNQEIITIILSYRSRTIGCRWEFQIVSDSSVHISY